jgi:predicted dehydrogenase
MSRRTTRRQFLRDTSLAGIGFWVAGGVALGASKAANEQLNIACIGVGGKGSSDVDGAGKVGNIVALCDVDSENLERKASKFPKAKKYADYRKMLEEMGKEIDAVTVSTPDHTHAPASIMAMKLGKHVYCQKPLTHTVWEARQMRDTARKYKVCTQMGNQGTAENGLRQAVEIVQAGVIGQVKEAHVWTNRPVWPQAPTITARPKEEEPVPSYLAWDLFLGTAPFRPFHHGKVNPRNPKRGTYHDFNWRGWWDFGTGALGDMACHTANMAFMALKLGHPTSIAAESGEINPETYPAWARIVFEFPARGEMPPVKFVWYEGQKDGKKVLPPEDLTKGLKLVDSGSLLVGTKGILYSPNDYGAQYRLLPEKDFEGFKAPDPTLPRNGKGDDGMKAEWAQAIKENKPALAVSNFDYAAMLTETILLGNVAMRVGKKLEWDGPNLKVTNAPEAEKYIKTEYRKGWTL